MTSQLIRLSVAPILLAATVFAPPASPQRYTFTNVIDSTGSLKAFDTTPKINNAGMVAFVAVDDAGERGVYAGRPGQVTKIVSGPSPRFFGYVVFLNDQGDVLYNDSDVGRTTRIMKWRSGAPEIFADASGRFSDVSAIGLNDAGTVVFGATLDDGTGGIFIGSDSEQAARIATSLVGPIDINSGGVVAYSGDESRRPGVFLHRDGEVETLVDPSYFAERFPEGGGIHDIQINDDGEVVFLYLTASAVGRNRYFVFHYSEGRLETLIESHPDARVYSLNSPALNGNGDILYRASLDNGGFFNFVGGLFTGPDVDRDYVLRTGDPLFGAALRNLETAPFTVLGTGGTINDRGQVAFSYILDNGVQGIAIATPAADAGPSPELPEASITDAASYLTPSQAGQGLGVGAIVSVFGENLGSDLAVATLTPLPTTLDGVSVTFNGVPAPLFFVAPNQLNVQVPFELLTDGREASVEVQVTTLAGNSEIRTVQIEATSPSIFTLNQSGTGQGIVVFPNTATLVAPAGLTADARPARRGEMVTIYANGLGAVDPPIASGRNSCEPTNNCLDGSSTFVIRTVQQTPTLEVGGVVAPPDAVRFAALAPEFVGLYQIHVLLPRNAPLGSAVPIRLVQGDTASQEGVTIAIQ